MHASFGVNSQASGSCYLELANTRVQCSVFGPREASNFSTFFQNVATETDGSSDELEIAAPGTLACTVQFAPFARRSRSVDAALLNTDAEERRLCRALHQALAPTILLARLPRSVIEVHCLILESCGEEEAGVIAGASLALAEAGVELIGLCACARAQGGHVSADDDSPRFLAGPVNVHNDRHTSGRKLQTTIAQVVSSNIITRALIDGEADANDISSTLRCTMEACVGIDSQMRAALTRSVERKSRAQQI